MNTGHSADDQQAPCAPRIAPIPAPRNPVGDALRRLMPRPTGPAPLGLDMLIADLVEVAVWTAREGSWQEHASFLLGTSDGRWHVVGFSDIAASELVARLCTLPHFDTCLLFDLIAQHTRRVVTLWRRPEHPKD